MIIREFSDSNLETGRYDPKSGVSRIPGRADSHGSVDKEGYPLDLAHSNC